MSEHDDTDLIERIHRELPRLPIPDASPAAAMARGRARRRSAFVRTTLIVVMLAAAVIVPIKMLSGLGDHRTEGSADVPPAPAGRAWPTVVIGGPANAYIDRGNPDIAKGSEHVLASGTVGGSEFSFLGYSRQDTSGCSSFPGCALRSRPCIEIAGPADPVRSAGVGGWCVPYTSQESQAGWPPFPEGADILMRSEVAGGGGVCRHCVRPARQPVEIGFVTERVVRLEVALQDGSLHDVPVLSWRNDELLKSFVFFPPSSYEVGQLLAYDADGHLLAQAPLCGPDTGTNTCDVSPTVQIAPMPSP